MKELKNRSVQKTTVGLSIAAFAAMCVVVLIILWNSSLLKEAIEERTKNYLDDVSVQTAQIIDSRLQASLDSLMLLADSDFDLDAEPLLDFLQKKAAVLNFDMLGIADAKEGTVFSSSGQEDFKNLPEFASALTGESSIGVYQNYILYTVPVYKDGSVAGVLAGVKTTEKMQELISNNAFHGEGSTCVVDSEGHVIVDPTRKQFSSLIAETTYDANADWAKSMLRDLAQNKAGSSVLPTESGVGIMMSYQPLKYYEWFVVTLIPKDILSAQITSIVNQTFAIAIFLVSLFLALLIVVIAMQARYKRRLEKAAFADTVTGGMSNIRFRMLTEEIIKRNPKNRFAIVALNIRKFKLINDVEGSEKGDMVLQKLYRIIEQSLVGRDEIAARGEADNFYMLMEFCTEDELRRRLEEISGKAGGIPCEAGQIYLSQGVYVIEDTKMDLIAFQDRANLARTSVEDDYRSTCAFYNSHIMEGQKEAASLSGLLEAALADREFQVYFQPKVSLCDDKVAGAEALVRWNQPERGVLSPDSFIPICEKNGLIGRLDTYVLEEVCKLLRKWRCEGKFSIPISVNVSRQHIKSKDILKDYSDLLETYGIPPEMIELELTESIMFSYSEILQIGERIKEIHACGMRCALDDFGFGYSSLSLIKDLEIDCLKLDRQFFIDNGESDRGHTVVESVVKLAKKLKVQTVAEGVESASQVEFLRAVGCDMVQGYYFSKPLPAEEFEKLVEETNR